jgi:integrase
VRETSVGSMVPGVNGVEPLTPLKKRQRAGVNTVLPDFVVEALAATPKVTDRFYFWSGIGKLVSIVRSWQTRLRRLFKLAHIPDGHAHRFRDTFAVELLLAGVPIGRVSVLLGHQSVRITERHYAPCTLSARATGSRFGACLGSGPARTFER